MDKQKVGYSVRAAAAASDNPRQVLDYGISIGELRATRSGNRYIILHEDLVAWLRMCRDRGYFARPGVTQKDRQRLAALNRSKRAAA